MPNERHSIRNEQPIVLKKHCCAQRALCPSSLESHTGYCGLSDRHTAGISSYDVGTIIVTSMECWTEA